MYSASRLVGGSSTPSGKNNGRFLTRCPQLAWWLNSSALCRFSAIPLSRLCNQQNATRSDRLPSVPSRENSTLSERISVDERERKIKNASQWDLPSLSRAERRLKAQRAAEAKRSIAEATLQRVSELSASVVICAANRNRQRQNLQFKSSDAPVLESKKYQQHNVGDPDDDCLLYEDVDVAVFNKPYSWPAIARGRGQHRDWEEIATQRSRFGEMSLQQKLQAYVKGCPNEKLVLCHSLEAESTGALLVAKSKTMYTVILEQMRRDTFWKRVFWAIVVAPAMRVRHGGVINLGLMAAAAEASSFYLVPGIAGYNGSSTKARWRCLFKAPTIPLALVEIIPEGSSDILPQQIRAQCCYGLDSPILGDALYIKLHDNWRRLCGKKPRPENYSCESLLNKVLTQSGLAASSTVPAPLSSSSSPNTSSGSSCITKLQDHIHLHHRRIEFSHSAGARLPITCALPFHMRILLAVLGWNEAPSFDEVTATSKQEAFYSDKVANSTDTKTPGVNPVHLSWPKQAADASRQQPSAWGKISRYCPTRANRIFDRNVRSPASPSTTAAALEPTPVPLGPANELGMQFDSDHERYISQSIIERRTIAPKPLAIWKDNASTSMPDNSLIAESELSDP